MTLASTISIPLVKYKPHSGSYRQSGSTDSMNLNPFRANRYTSSSSSSVSPTLNVRVRGQSRVAAVVRCSGDMLVSNAPGCIDS
jgi:hypothetical protein